MDRQSRETVLVTNEMLDHYGITRDQLMSDAKENAPQLLPASLSSISEALGIPTDPGSMDMLYVASVEGMRHGAGVLAYPGFLNDAAEKLGGDFFILPSSIHEVLLMRDEGKRLPKVKDLSAEYGVILAEKRKLYEKYRSVKQDMMNYQIAKQDIDRFLKIDEEQRRQEKEPKSKNR